MLPLVCEAVRADQYPLILVRHGMPKSSQDDPQNSKLVSCQVQKGNV